jgi:glycosyltransferase involved in cell wall biosynthesis
LESILAQRSERIEVIAVDDASTDSTVAVLESFTPRLPLTIIQRTHTGNWVSATNFGLSAARGDYVSFLHQDDLWATNRLNVLVAAVARAPAAAMILHPSWFIDRRGRRVGRWRCPLPPDTELHGDLVRERLLVQNFIALPAPLFRRDAALKAGGLDENLWYTADWDFWLKLAAAGRTIYVPKALAAFRIYPESQTMRRSAQRDDFRRQLETVLDRHSKGRPIKRAVRRAARLSVNVNAALAARAHGQRTSWSMLALQFLALGPAGWRRYVRDSRIGDRVLARVRIGLVPHSG